MPKVLQTSKLVNLVIFASLLMVVSLNAAQQKNDDEASAKFKAATKKLEDRQYAYDLSKGMTPNDIQAKNAKSKQEAEVEAKVMKNVAKRDKQ